MMIPDAMAKATCHCDMMMGAAIWRRRQETVMNEIIAAATGLPLRVPDRRDEAYGRAQEFRRLSPEKRLEYFSDVIESGMLLIRQSPKRQLLDEIFLKREAEWQHIQQELFAHGK